MTMTLLAPEDDAGRLGHGFVGGRSGFPVMADHSTAPLPAPLELRRVVQVDADLTGSLGGLVPPGHVAVGPSGEIFLIDVVAGLLRRFDPCVCRFVTVPCFGGEGSGARQLGHAVTITCDRSNVYLCDPDHHRVVVLAIHGARIRAVWAPPRTEPAWLPVAASIGPRGILVLDAATNRVHHFAPRGRWLGAVAAPSGCTTIAVDIDGIVVLASPLSSLVHLAPTDSDSWTSQPLDQLDPSRFPTLPLVVVDATRFRLEPPCEGDYGSTVDMEFDGAGEPQPARLSPPLLETKRIWTSATFDSGVERCQWHRLVVKGRMPAQTSVAFETLSSSSELLAADVDAATNWKVSATMTEGSSTWDAAVLSGPGRYLWIRVTLHGNGRVSPSIDWIEVEAPRRSSLRYLPETFAPDAVSTEFIDRFLSVFDATQLSIDRVVDDRRHLFGIDSAPATPENPRTPDVLSWLASWIGVQFDPGLSVAERRRLLHAATTTTDRGTVTGLRRLLIAYLGLARTCPLRCPDPCRPEPDADESGCANRGPELILEHFRLRRWLRLGSACVGPEALLWGRRIVNRTTLGEGAQLATADGSVGTQLVSLPNSELDPFRVHAHRFSVFLPAAAARSEARRRAVERLIDAEKPAHTEVVVHYVHARFRIGVQSTLGLDSVIAAPIPGLRVGEPLGDGSVLGSPLAPSGSQSLTIGSTQVGLTTRVD